MSNDIENRLMQLEAASIAHEAFILGLAWHTTGNTSMQMALSRQYAGAVKRLNDAGKNDLANAVLAISNRLAASAPKP